MVGTVAEDEFSTARKLQRMKDAFALAKNPKGTRRRSKAVAVAVKEANKERAKAMRARKRAAQKQADDALMPSRMKLGDEWLPKMDTIEAVFKG